MALLGDIRKRSWLLILGIGLPLFAFIIGDAFSQGNVFGDPNELGSVAGTPINVQEYNLAYNRLSRNPQLQEAGDNVLSEMAWNQMVSEVLVKNQMEDLGLSVNENKYFEEAGRFYSSVNPNLMDANGRVNIELTKSFLAELRNAAMAGDPQAQNFYEQWENADPQFRLLNSTYVGLVSAGGLATDVEANFLNKSNAANQIEYVSINYEEYAMNNPIEVSDADILAYMKNHPKNFKAEPSVNLAYAYFAGGPSDEDNNQLVTELNSYLAPQIIHDEINNITDTISSFANAVNDSVFVSRFSDNPFDPTYYTKEQFEGFPDDNLRQGLLDAEKGDIIGPVRLGDMYNLIKISDVRPITDSARTSHILIGFVGSQARGANITRSAMEAQSLADSLMTEIRANPSKFDEFARTLSDDQVAAQSGGDIGWVGRFQQGFAVSYRDFAVTNPKGTIDVVYSDFGYHIIRIDDVKQKMGYQLANIQRQLRASEETQENLFSLANNLAIDAQNQTANDFINAARQQGGEVNVAEGVGRFETNLVGLTGTRKEADVLRWAFNKETKPGSVQVFETLSGGQIVAYVTDKFEKGNYNIAAARTQVERLIRNEKITEKIAAEVGNSDLNSIASKYGATIQSASVNFSRPMIEGVGLEPAIGGAAFGLKEGSTSGAIQGNFGVYFVKLVSKGTVADIGDGSAFKTSAENQTKSQIQNSLIPSLIDASKIKDNRIKRLN